MGKSRYTRKKMLEIGCRIAEHELTKYSAAIEYDISPYTARDYLRLYKASAAASNPDSSFPGDETGDKYKEMSRRELVNELIAMKEKIRALTGD